MDLTLLKDASLLVNAVGAGNCFLFALIHLNTKKTKDEQPSPILSTLFFIIGAIILNTIFNLTGHSELFYGFEPITNALAFAIAPLLYLYIKFYKHTWTYLFIRSNHLIPTILLLAITAVVLYKPQSPLGTVGHQIITSDVTRILWNVHFLVYLLCTFGILRKKEKNQWRTQKFIAVGIASIWLLNLLFYFFSMLFYPLPAEVYLNITLLFSAMTLYLFYKNLGITSVPRSFLKVGSSKHNQTIETDEKDPIIQKIKNNRYYRDPNLDIRSLSSKLCIPYHELSAEINQKYKKNFNEFINSFRIQEVVEALHMHQHQSYTIMGLAQKAGFRSASAFYSAFKKEQGTTPTQFIQQNHCKI